jgi:hypothetical protein
MSVNLKMGLFSLAVASVLAACASAPPPAAPAAPARAAVASTAAPGKAATADAEFKRVQRGGKELFCKREAITGSRTNVQETCLTESELAAYHENAQRILRDMAGGAERKTQTDSGGGRTNSVMTQ